MAQYDKEGREIPDDTPVEMPLGFKHPPTIQEMIQQAIRVEMSRQAAEQGMESFEESDDFEVGEEFEDNLTPFELKEMQEEYIIPAPKGGGKDERVESAESVKGVESSGRVGAESKGGDQPGPGSVADDSKGKSEAVGKT